MSKYIQDDLCQQILNYLDKQTLMNILRSKYDLRELEELYVLPTLEEHMANEEEYEFPEPGKLYDLGEITKSGYGNSYTDNQNGIRKTPIGELRLDEKKMRGMGDVTFLFRAKINNGHLYIKFLICQTTTRLMSTYCIFHDGSCYGIFQIKEVKN